MKSEVRVALPAEVPPEEGARTIHLVVREKGKCRECGEEILRVSSRVEGIWIHRGRLKGKPYSHTARDGSETVRREPRGPGDA